MDWYHLLVGYDHAPLTWWQMSIRGLVLFGFAVALIRLGGMRLFGKNTALDIVVAIILGSNLSRAMTGTAPLIPTVVLTVVLVAAHTALLRITRRHERLSGALKGHETHLVENGEVSWDRMDAAGIARGDLEEAMRLGGHQPDIERIAHAYLERNGQISIIMR